MNFLCRLFGHHWDKTYHLNSGSFYDPGSEEPEDDAVCTRCATPTKIRADFENFIYNLKPKDLFG